MSVRVHPDAIEAYRLGKAAWPDGDSNPPDWWPWGIGEAYRHGRWHAIWTAEMARLARIESEEETA